MIQAKVIRCFLGADLRSSHDGLSGLARKNKIKTEELGQGDFLLFINNKRDKIKLYAGGDVLAYYRMPRGEFLNMNVISKIPQAFLGSGKIDYDKVLSDVVKEEMSKRRARSPMAVAKAS